MPSKKVVPKKAVTKKAGAKRAIAKKAVVKKAVSKKVSAAKTKRRSGATSPIVSSRNAVQFNNLLARAIGTSSLVHVLNHTAEIGTVSDSANIGLKTQIGFWPGDDGKLVFDLNWSKVNATASKATFPRLTVRVTGTWPQHKDAALIIVLPVDVPASLTEFTPVAASCGLDLGNQSPATLAHVVYRQGDCVTSDVLATSGYSFAVFDGVMKSGAGDASMTITVGVSDAIRTAGVCEFTIDFPRIGTTYHPEAMDTRLLLGKQAAIKVTADQKTMQKVAARFKEKSGKLAAERAIKGAAQQFMPPYFVQKTGRSMSYPIIIGNRNAQVWYDRHPGHDLDFFADNGIVARGDVVFDCGAHTGVVAAYLANMVGKKGRIVTFDPFEQNNLQIEANAELNGMLKNYEVVRGGVGEVTRLVAASNESQTLRESTGKGDTQIQEHALDDFINRKPTLIKLDVEGYDIFALRGARKLAREVRPKWFIEYHTQFLLEQGLDVEEVFDIISPDLYDISVGKLNGSYEPYRPGTFKGLRDDAYIIAKPKK